MELVQQNHIASPYRNLPLMQLQESPTNPRRRYDAAALQELAVSIQSQGILAPLLLRRLEPSQFEVIAGSRRFRAGKIGTFRCPRPHRGDDRRPGARSTVR